MPRLLALNGEAAWAPSGWAHAEPSTIAGGGRDRIDRIKALGNLNPPVIAQAWGNAILSVMNDR